jgi:hypothetical protein
MQYEVLDTVVTCHDTHHSGSTSVIMDILIISVIDEVASTKKPKGSLYFFGLFNVVEDDPTRGRFPCEESRIGVNMQHLMYFGSDSQTNLKRGTYSVASNGPVCTISNPSCTILLVSVDQTLPQAFSIALTTFYLDVEALHIFLQLGAN